MAGRNERVHIWRDEIGTPVLKHTKYTTPDGTKHFPWYHRIDFGNGVEHWFKGKGADDGIVAPLLYPLDLFARASRSEHAYLAEGERDCDSLIGAGVIAVTAGGVFEFKAEHAALFRGWVGPISIVRDNDVPGAVGALRTHELLREIARIPASRLRIARGRCKAAGADAHDHLSAGFTVNQFVSEPIAKVRKLAATATAADFDRAGYDRPPRYVGDTGWVVVGADEAAQLHDWEPRTP